MESPCVQVCVMDSRSALCAGCGRTLAEIAAWSTFTPAERRRIMALLPERRRQAEAAATAAGD
ncbi:MAG TPA: DUF1289 domain-containing protein [Hyphomicrobiaceae bacterium]|nr:DUF1289 domain-containing protein [Hyphomicrobiaceae bacterium]